MKTASSLESHEAILSVEVNQHIPEYERYFRAEKGKITSRATQMGRVFITLMWN
jgi:hypothetical protein